MSEHPERDEWCASSRFASDTRRRERIMPSLITVSSMLVILGAPPVLRAAAWQGAPHLPLDETVTIAVEHVPLKYALDEVARRAGVRIAYSGRVVPLERPVSVQLDAVSVRVALDQLLQGAGSA